MDHNGIDRVIICCAAGVTRCRERILVHKAAGMVHKVHWLPGKFTFVVAPADVERIAPMAHQLLPRVTL
ncbi:MAG: hypothetical protein V1790_16360 [Planctomycetota bacterium]